MHQTDLLPELWTCVFTLCSSKDRSILCQISREWYNMALVVSKRLSTLSYDDTTYNNGKLYQSGDYHLIVRLKREYLNMFCISVSGNIDVVNLMISHGANNWNYGLIGACRRGHLELADLMISLGANDWNWGLRSACRGYHLKLVNLMILNGATAWDDGLYEACYHGHLELAKMMISLGASRWNSCLAGACLGGHLELVELMISYGANNWHWGLSEACRGHHKKIVKLMISQGATTCSRCNKLAINHTKNI